MYEVGCKIDQVIKFDITAASQSPDGSITSSLVMPSELLVAFVTISKTLLTWQQIIIKQWSCYIDTATFDAVHKRVEMSFIDAACLVILAKRSARSLPAIANLTGG